MTDVAKKPIAGSAPGGLSPIGALEQKSRDAKGNLGKSMYPSSRDLAAPKPDAAAPAAAAAGTKAA